MKKKIDFNLFQKTPIQSTGGGLLLQEMQAMIPESNELNDVVSKVTPSVMIVWVSEKNWSIHELLLALLNITGPAVVHISSYAMSETPARTLSMLIDAGTITELYCLLDNRVEVRTAKTIQLIKNICTDYALIDTHAKVTIIQNNDWQIAVIGSANYTGNERYESGVIIEGKEAVNQQLFWMKKALKNGTK
jgi:hypothetical protein